MKQLIYIAFTIIIMAVAWHFMKKVDSYKAPEDNPEDDQPDEPEHKDPAD